MIKRRFTTQIVRNQMSLLSTDLV